MFGVAYWVVAICFLFYLPGVSILMFLVWVLKHIFGTVHHVVTQPTGQKAIGQADTAATPGQDPPSEPEKPDLDVFMHRAREVEDRTLEVTERVKDAVPLVLKTEIHQNLTASKESHDSWQDKIEAELRS